jgi:hypothetical protein
MALSGNACGMALAAHFKTKCMQDDKQQQPKDRNLDIPAEANRTKHINFLDEEDESRTSNGNNDDFATERRKQWQEGLEEGERARRESE